MKKNKKLIYLIIAISFIAISAIGATYAYFLASGYGNKTSTVSVTADALDEVSCTATDLSMTVTGSDMKQGSSSSAGTVGKTNSSNITCTSTKHTTGTTECTMNIKYTPTNVFTKSTNNTLNRKELTLSGAGTATNGMITSPNYNETDMSTLTSATTIIDGLKWVFSSDDTMTYTMTTKFYNFDYNQNDLANHTYSGTISVENISCTSISPTYETVTLNANGGSVSPSTKQVTYGYTYGNLPQPTKSGATFKGWHGKNMLDIDKVKNTGSQVVFSNNSVLFDGSYVSGNTGTAIVIQKYKNGSYVTNADAFYITTGKHSYSFTKTSDFDRLLIKLNTSKADPYFFLNAPNFFVEENNYVISYNVDFYDKSKAQAILSNIQIEEGSTSTAYEPYYITKDTVVAQSGNHTLTAIWE